jgi:ABC-type uncharacterized transport system involved in gliding motility auxiliary subunit
MSRSLAAIAALALVLAAILFLSVNALSGRFLRGAQADLTENGLYTISDGTRAILTKIDEPVTLRFYYSDRLGQIAPAYGVYAQRVRELLRRYADLAHGKIALEILDPAPFSETEDQATAAGLQGVPVEEGGEPVYFGLAGSNSTDDQETIPFFNADREPFLEYDVTKLIQTLAFPKKKIVGLISTLSLDGDQLARMQGQPSQPEQVLSQLRQIYEVRTLATNVDKIPDDIDVLMIVQPSKLPPATEYAIDQFVMGGGHALVFADPNAEFSMARPAMGQRPSGPSAADFDAVLKSWGVELVKGKIVGDRLAARRVSLGGPSRVDSADYVAWLSLQGDDINRTDPITAQLGQINMATAGALQPVKDAKTKFEPLIRSSAQSELIDAARVESFRPDILGLLADFVPTGQRYALAARITGPAQTAFPDGPPKAEKTGADATKPATQIKVAKQPIDVIVVTDGDMLDDRFWVQMQDFLGRQVAAPTAQNGDFVQNAIDDLMGSGELIGLRSRGSSVRPFLRVNAIQREAQDRYQAHEKELQDRLRATQAKLADVKGQPDAQGNVALTPDQQKAVEQLRSQMIQTRTELRQVQLALRQNIDRLKLELGLVNIGLVPALVALTAIAIGILRYRRRRIRAPAG